MDKFCRCCSIACRSGVIAAFYAGSYATVNGKRLTDIEDILKAQAEADAFCQRVEDMAAADFERLTSENLER